MADQIQNQDIDRYFVTRNKLSHGVYVSPNKPTIVFLTICTKDRVPWLANKECHELLVDVWMRATAWMVGRYVIMPDHVHLFATMGQPDSPLENWVRYFKSQFTKRFSKPDCRWQTDHWDTRIRTAKIYEEKGWYVFNNPVRKGLVASPELWPFQGVLNEIRWD